MMVTSFAASCLIFRMPPCFRGCQVQPWASRSFPWGSSASLHLTWEGLAVRRRVSVAGLAHVRSAIADGTRGLGTGPTGTVSFVNAYDTQSFSA